jgi:peroxiredoxin
MTRIPRVALIVALAGGVAAAHVGFKQDLDTNLIHNLAGTLHSQRVWVGKVAPDFELPLRDGKSFHLADYVGKKVIVLNFFATWCAPCRKEMPEFDRYYSANRDKDFLLIGVDVNETPKLVDDFVAQLGLNFPIGIDDHGNIAHRYGTKGYPTTVVIGVTGRVLVYEVGPIANADVTFDALVDAERRLIAAGLGITREKYLALAAAEDYGDLVEKPKAANLSGRAATIAQAMYCTCGCENKLDVCTCKTAQDIKKKLVAEMNSGGYEKMSDADVITALDKEFCIPGKQDAQSH